MGKYINSTSKGPLDSHDKAASIVADGGIKLGSAPTDFVPNLVCVVNNGPFEAAAYCNSANEFAAFNDAGDYRPKIWLTWDKVAQFAR